MLLIPSSSYIPSLQTSENNFKYPIDVWHFMFKAHGRTKGGRRDFEESSGKVQILSVVDQKE